jgi:hypothetical protein
MPEPAQPFDLSLLLDWLNRIGRAITLIDRAGARIDALEKRVAVLEGKRPELDRDSPAAEFPAQPTAPYTGPNADDEEPAPPPAPAGHPKLGR